MTTVASPRSVWKRSCSTPAGPAEDEVAGKVLVVRVRFDEFKSLHSVENGVPPDEAASEAHVDVARAPVPRAEHAVRGRLAVVVLITGSIQPSIPI